jgi:hypothetical protein
MERSVSPIQRVDRMLFDHLDVQEIAAVLILVFFRPEDIDKPITRLLQLRNDSFQLAWIVIRKEVSPKEALVGVDSIVTHAVKHVHEHFAFNHLSA